MPSAKDPRDLKFVDHVLTNLARAYRPTGFIGDIVAPRIPVAIDSGKFPVFDGFFDDEVDPKVSDRAETPEVDFTWSEDTYATEDYRLKASITRKEERNAHSVIRLRQNKLFTVQTRLALRRESRIAAMLRKTSNGGQLNLGAAPSTNWDQATATIEADIKTGATAVYDATGMVTNTIVIPYKVAYEMSLQEDIREIIKYTVDGRKVLELGDRLLPAVLHGHRVIVPMGAMRNSAKEGAVRSLSDVWADHARLLYLPEGGGGWGIPSTAYQFTALQEVVDRWRSDDPPVEYVRAWENVDEKVCAPNVGYELASLLS